MNVWILCLVFAFVSSTPKEDTAVKEQHDSFTPHEQNSLIANTQARLQKLAGDIGAHQLERLVELLTPTECEDLLFALSHPEENIFEHLERLSPERNTLGLDARAKRDKRDTSFSVDSEAQCRTALTDWLLRYGEQTYYDKLSRGLQHVGRTDIAIEVGKNINQDKALSLKRFVDDYHKYVSSLNVASAPSDARQQPHAGHRVRKRKVEDLTSRDLELIVEQAPLPPYRKGPLDVARPLFYGLLLGFGGTLVAGIVVLLVVLAIPSRNAQASNGQGLKKQ